VHFSEETPFSVEGDRTRLGGDGVSLRTLEHGIVPRVGLVIPPAARVVFASAAAPEGEAAGLLVFGPAGTALPAGGLSLRVRFRPTSVGADSERGVELFSERIEAADPKNLWLERRFPVPPLPGGRGSLVVECETPSAGVADGAALALYELVVSDAASLDLERARTFNALRQRNEKANFDAYYKHVVFQQDSAPPPPARDWKQPLRWARASAARVRDSLVRLGAHNAAALEQAPPPPAAETAPAPTDPKAARMPPPAPPRSSILVAREILARKLSLTPPSFYERMNARLAARAPGTKLRVLSLCSGEARIEEGLVRHTPPGSVHLTVCDLNPDLLKTATRRLEPFCEVDGIVGDVNEIDLRGQSFDVALCVSGLHHVVELEHLFDQIAGAVGPDGEFWSIGETLGRNGGRMWPESYEVANAFFRRLPPKYRANRVLASAIDEELPDMDYSIGCFEGIRSEAIVPTIARHFEPLQVSRHNCIIWKLFSTAYADNYDTSLHEDLALIEEAVDLDVGLTRNPVLGIELHGIFRRRAPGAASQASSS
jgi:SAM-dependent methyltransferase